MTARRWLLRPLGAAACALFIYWMSAGIAMFVPVGQEPSQESDSIDVFMESNGVHVDLLLPVANRVADWRKAGLVRFGTTRYLAFSWGERDFFLKTPTWADFDPLVGAGALLWQSDVLMHVTEVASPWAGARRVPMTEEQYRRLTAYVLRSFRQPPTPVGNGYGPSDRFYEGTGTYSPFMTCNEWVNRALRSAGLRAALWSPLPWGVMRHGGPAL